MKPLSPSDSNHILFLLDSCYSGEQISSQTGVSNATISRLHSRHCTYLKKAPGGRPSKLSDTDIRYALRLIGSGKVDDAVQVTKSLQNITNQPLSAQTVWNRMKKVGMKSMVKRKRPLLTKKYMKKRLDFAIVAVRLTRSNAVFLTST